MLLASFAARNDVERGAHGVTLRPKGVPRSGAPRPKTALRGASRYENLILNPLLV